MVSEEDQNEKVEEVGGWVQLEGASRSSGRMLAGDEFIGPRFTRTRRRRDSMGLDWIGWIVLCLPLGAGRLFSTKREDGRE